MAGSEEWRGLCSVVSSWRVFIVAAVEARPPSEHIKACRPLECVSWTAPLHLTTCFYEITLVWTLFRTGFHFILMSPNRYQVKNSIYIRKKNVPAHRRATCEDGSQHQVPSQHALFLQLWFLFCPDWQGGQRPLLSVPWNLWAADSSVGKIKTIW